jgi:DHA1 family multidrug resistance protein-like MFS transporter
VIYCFPHSFINPLLFFLDYVFLNSLLACFSPAVWKYASLTNKDHIFGSMGATTSLGYFFGAILSGFLFESLGMNTLFFLSLAACFLGLVITLFSHDLRQSSPITGHESSNSSLQNKTTATNFLTLLFSSKILIVLFVIAIIQNFQGTFAGMFVTIYFLDELNTPPVLIGLVFGIATLAGAVASHYFGKIGEKRGYKELLVICYIGYLLVWISFIISVTDYLLPAVAYTLPIYVALFIAGPALVAKHIPEEKRGTFMGVFGASQNIGFAAGTILGGYFASQQGTIRFNFEISAIISVILIIFTLLFFKEERSSKD